MWKISWQLNEDIPKEGADKNIWAKDGP